MQQYENIVTSWLTISCLQYIHHQTPDFISFWGSECCTVLVEDIGYSSVTLIDILARENLFLKGLDTSQAMFVKDSDQEQQD